MKTFSLNLALVFAAIILSAFPFSSRAADLAAEDQNFLASYEKVRVALAADDLPGAKTAASEFGEEGAVIAKSDKIESARAEFTRLSERAIKLGTGRSEYYVVRCPMLKKEWLQPSSRISNPYAGKSMPECGVIKK